MTETNQTAPAVDWREDYRLRREAAKALLDKLGIIVGFQFVPQSQSRYAIEKPKPGSGDPPRGGYGGKGEPCLNWIITVIRGGRLALKTEYSSGIGHLPEYIPGSGNRLKYTGRTLAEVESARRACEEGKLVNDDRIYTYGTVPTPDPVDVLYSLVQDGAAFWDHAVFEEWAGDYGFDPDSRSAEKVYNECREIGASLSKVLGPDEIRQLREAFAGF